MSTEANKERIHKLLQGIGDCDVKDAVIVFEMPTSDGIKPHILQIGSPMACMALTEWAASFQHEQVYEGLEVSVWYDDEDESDEV